MKRLLSVLPILAAFLLCYACSEKNESTISVTSVTITPSSLTLDEGGRQQLEVVVLPENASEKTVAWSSSAEDVAVVSSSGLVVGIKEGPATITASCGGKFGTCAVMVKKSSTEPQGAVDLGLPSGLKWASCNLGASTPEAQGDYYAWGEVEPYYKSQNPLTWKEEKTGYDWASYKWCHGEETTLTKYCTNSSYGDVDNITELQRGEKSGETIDDAAYAKLVSKWRMPRKADFEELINNTNNAWTTYNGVNGWRFISKTNSANWIFLPAAGRRYGTSLGDDNSNGLYWSSSLVEDNPKCSWFLYFNNTGIIIQQGVDRSDGLIIRPVYDK